MSFKHLAISLFLSDKTDKNHKFDRNKNSRKKWSTE